MRNENLDMELDIVGTTDGVKVTMWVLAWDICQRLEFWVGTCVSYEVHGRHLVLAFSINAKGYNSSHTCLMLR